MTAEVSLLDHLALQMGCRMVSELHELAQFRRAALRERIARIDTAEATLFEWNDALTYLTDNAPQETREEAKRQLMQTLSHPQLWV